MMALMENRAPSRETRRIVHLDGGTNFRDVGGYPALDGGQVRWGRVYRSGALHRLTERDLTTVDELGLRTVYDLRRDEERRVNPSILPAGVAIERLPIGGAAAKTRELTDLLAEGRMAELPSDFLERIYESMAEAAAPMFGQLLRGLAEPGGTPALIHCTAGKDRTGLSIAFLLAALGVGEPDILDDYELSAIHFTGPMIARLKENDPGVDLDRYQPVLGAPRQALASLFVKLTERYGSVDSYLTQEASVTPEVFAQLRAQLVEAPSGL